MESKKQSIQEQIDALNEELKEVIYEYCNLLGCKKCPNKCRATEIDDRIFNLNKKLHND